MGEPVYISVPLVGNSSETELMSALEFVMDQHLIRWHLSPKPSETLNAERPCCRLAGLEIQHPGYRQ